MMLPSLAVSLIVIDEEQHEGMKLLRENLL